MKKYFLVIFILAGLSFAQGSAGQNAKYEYRSLIDLPTAGVLEKGFVGVSLDLMPLGTVISKIEVGVFDNFSFGISYGGANILGSGSIKWYNLPGVNARVRVMNETTQMPALTIGFDSQGKGDYINSTNRFSIKSPGFFLAAAKNFEFLGYLSIHGVINYSLERDDNDKDMNLGIGVEKTIGERISVMAEYDFAINDNNSLSFGDGSGYLNFGARWTIGQGFTLGLNLRDLLDNKKLYSAKADRGLFIEYIKAIF
ncbi:MAG: hypothetical protein Fur0015_15290 [Ignavibacteriales bacterium]